MRIIVASPPKTGNIWMKTLLVEIYDLKVLTDRPNFVYQDLPGCVEFKYKEPAPVQTVPLPARPLRPIQKLDKLSKTRRLAGLNDTHGEWIRKSGYALSH